MIATNYPTPLKSTIRLHTTAPARLYPVGLGKALLIRITTRCNRAAAEGERNIYRGCIAEALVP